MPRSARISRCPAGFRASSAVPRPPSPVPRPPSSCASFVRVRDLSLCFHDLDSEMKKTGSGARTRTRTKEAHGRRKTEDGRRRRADGGRRMADARRGLVVTLDRHSPAPSDAKTFAGSSVPLPLKWRNTSAMSTRECYFFFEPSRARDLVDSSVGVVTVAARTAGQPAGEDTGHRQASGDERILEMPLRPRCGADETNLPVLPRGGNAARVRR
jgi:hypothetical protein